MRCAPQCPDSQTSRYQAAIAMASWADQNSVDVIGLSEHHATEDGFSLSTPATRRHDGRGHPAYPYQR